MFTLSINTENAAFHDDDDDGNESAMRAETVRILRNIAGKIEAGGIDSGKIKDINGNTIGSFSF